MKTLKKILAVLTIIFIASCSKNDDTATPELTNPLAISDVYIAGSTTNSNNIKVPTIWKNGVATILPSDTNVNTVAGRIIVSGNDVYVVNSNTDDTNDILLWKNGNLTEIANNYRLKQFTVDNGNVYILGEDESGNSYLVKYWKNGIPTILSSTLNYINNMIVSNDDVYVCGSEYNGTKNVAKYWKNGTATNVSDGTLNSFGNAIAVNGSEISIFLREISATNTISYKVWKNGNTTTLKSGIYNDGSVGSASIAYESNNLHMATVEQINSSPNNTSKILYWRNGLESQITAGNSYAGFRQMKVIGNDIYIVGYENNISNIAVLKYWKNGQVTALTDGTTNFSTQSSFSISANKDIHIVIQNQYFKNNVASSLLGNNATLFDVFTTN
jgi:hypothetical protein